MPRHRLEPAARVRARVGRMAAAGISLVVTMVALLGGIGVIPLQGSRTGSAEHTPAATGEVNGSASTTDTTGASRSRVDPSVIDAVEEKVAATQQVPDTALPADAGTGRRVVFSTSAQRVWLVDADGTVAATYLVSGSVTDNLGPGKYDVYSRSRWAVGIQDSGVMEYFVRFAHGANAAIGFHSIPSKNGTALQTVAQLGTPLSHGCIRQKLSDAKRMWDFADVGTDVVVVT
jgi:hypothetical protein